MTERPVYCKSLLFPPDSRNLERARGPRAGFGVAPKQSFLCVPAEVNRTEPKKVCDREDPLASTRDACDHSTVTLLARLRGLSTSRPSSTAK